MLQDDLHQFDGLLLAYLRFDYLRRELLHHLSVLHHLRDESRFHHLSVICYGIIECHCGYRRNLCLISDTHPCKSRLTPVYVLSA